MTDLTYSLAAAAVAAAATAVFARRSLARARAEAKQQLVRATDALQHKANAELTTQRERGARAVATLKDEIAALRRAATERAYDEDDERARAAHEARAEMTPLDPEPRVLAQWLSQELATIVSGIEGGTFRLIDSAPSLRAETDGVESLWLAIRRLRRFHDKIQAYVRAPQPTAGTTPIERLLTSLRDELSTTALGLQIAWNLPQTSLAVRGDQDELTAALTLACKALRLLEKVGLRLSIEVEPSFDCDEPEVLIELTLERDEAPDPSAPATPPTAGFLVARTAAQNVFRALGGSIAFVHEPDHESRALVQLPLQTPEFEPTTAPSAEPGATPARAVPPEEEARIETDLATHLAAVPESFGRQTIGDERAVPIPRRHRYGGVLVIEGDPAVRTMLAAEFKAHGRAVFACPDGAAARSLIQATPDRFEVLVVDHGSRLEAGDLLASTVARLCPELRVFVLSEFDQQLLPVSLQDRVTEIKKPFGVHELRRALSAALMH